MDWKVKIRLVKFSELGEAVARIEPDLDSKTAVMLLLCAEDFEAEIDPDFPMTYEGLIVHELLHLHFYPLTMETKEPVLAEEQAIECITDALLFGYKK